MRKAAGEFRKNNLRIVVFDAWRPERAQALLREFCDDDKYVSARPRHTAGNIIDMSLADSNGAYLDMGTDYDDFSEKAHSNDGLVVSWQKDNRQLLRDVMLRHGFVIYPYEWWDFEYKKL